MSFYSAPHAGSCGAGTTGSCRHQMQLANLAVAAVALAKSLKGCTIANRPTCDNSNIYTTLDPAQEARAGDLSPARSSGARARYERNAHHM